MAKRYNKVVRLRTGEILLCQVERPMNSVKGVSFVDLFVPVQMFVQRNGPSEQYVMTPWFNLSDSEELEIPVDQVLTIGDMKDEVIEKYQGFLNRREEERLAEVSRQETIARRKAELEQHDAAMSLLQSITPDVPLRFIEDPHDTPAAPLELSEDDGN